ncbi:fatty acyl-CoA hydrolase precursor, medium chain-like isoform X2 [Scyliorhinus canicula]|uniref:fatty acyl-CoA hydrolase precursor, medium chain-like isoform X2 n=1 Tax=Scyliorhinus canicula TaxID=7830 RepID=UPI0018F7B54F|nr:fatty acyl-CoA hydrolase precursor, medium chain-like isoform X2 [Scyliorhinus canicula]
MGNLGRGVLPLAALLILGCPALWAAETNEEPPVVVTKYGQLEGKKLSVKGTHQSVYRYLAIPFAKPPVGPLRFTVPQAVKAWTGIRKATEQPAGCLQDANMLKTLLEMMHLEVYQIPFKEDCLYLNVYTPVRPKDRNTRFPVMVWIHGGGFVMGDSYFYDGSPLAAYEDVVVVVIQYRLGIIGFLSTGDEHLPGNLGMLDQIAALKWVQENIESFGGDPGSVTIFGESAGSISVSLHIVSPLSSGLFHKAISESGTNLIATIVTSDPKSTAVMIANLAGCNTSHSKEIVDCLGKMSEEELMNIPKPPKELLLFPVVDGTFLPQNVETLLETGQINSVPYLLGVNNHEWGWLIPKMYNPAGWEEGMDRVTSDSLLKNGSRLREDQLQLAIDEYMGHTEDKVEIRDFHLELLSDLFMLVPTVQLARIHRDAGHPVFLYEFQHRPSFLATRRPEFVKSDHGDEIGFVFGSFFVEDGYKLLANCTEEEKVLSRTMMAYWANFAKKGCLQKIRNRPAPFSVPASEDCLYLSVYTPAHPQYPNNSIPVMVWIHGGAFILGSSSVFHGTALAGYGNVVVVVIQYRISVAGFLSTGDSCAQGNFGFLDQLAALKWVQRNIAQFGGNPGMVTLFGESVGGLSVSLHTLSPLSVGLFHKAILQSGSALMPGLLPPLPTQLAHEVAEIAGCGNTQSEPLLHCLRNKTEEEMAQITNSLNALYQLIPALIVDEHILPDDPRSMFQNGMFQNIPYLIGVTTEEGVQSLVHPEKIFPPNWETGITIEQIKEKINTFLTPIFGEENQDLIFDEYFKDAHDPDMLKERYIDMFGDVYITQPTLRAAQYYKDAGNPVFLYEFQHRASFYDARIPQFKRAPHGAELSFVFGGSFIPAFEVILGGRNGRVIAEKRHMLLKLFILNSSGQTQECQISNNHNALHRLAEVLP